MRGVHEVDMSFLGGDPLESGQSGDADRVSIDAGEGFTADPVGYVAPADDAHAPAFAEPTSPEDHLWMHSDGRVWDLGPADIDTDADGVPDSLTRSGAGGMTVYTDSDRDGQVDKITEVDADGMFSSRTLDPTSGTWVPTDRGRLG